MTWRFLLPALLLIAGSVAPRAESEGVEEALEVTAPQSAIAHLQVRTLVMDALGTRTVDVAVARVPYNSTGLLMRQVPYGGPPLSFRLLVKPETPSEEGIRLVMNTEVWSGGLDEGLSHSLERREETAVIALDSSYLLELAHERAAGSGSAGSERRVVLSITLSDEDDPSGACPGTLPLRAVHFVFQMIRQNGPTVDPPETHVLSSLVGRPVSYSSSVMSLAAGADGAAGLTFTLAAEGTQGELVTVRLRVSGFDYADESRTHLVAVAYESLHTVRSGSSFLVEVPVKPPDSAAAEGKPPVAWVLNVTPRLA